MTNTQTIFAADQTPLVVETFGNNQATVLIINPAIGVKRKLYRPLAEFMAKHDITTVLYNYRGMEDGYQDLPKGVLCDTETWGRQDQSAVIKWAHSNYQPNTLVLMGHSLGGQLPGFADDLSQVDGLIHVAAQKGDKRLWSLAGYLKLWLLWHVLIPLMSRGQHFAARKLGLGSYPWPAAAARQWARWGQQKGYLFNAKFEYELRPWHQFNRPILSFGFKDDSMAPEAAIDGLLQEYGKALKNDQRHIDKHIIDPHNLGLESIGHFGFYKQEAQALWQDTVKWMRKL